MQHLRDQAKIGPDPARKIPPAFSRVIFAFFWCLILPAQTHAGIKLDLPQITNEAQKFLETWFQNRVIPGDIYVNERYQKLKHRYVVQAQSFPKVEEKSDLDPKIMGYYDYDGTIWIRANLGPVDQITTVIHEGTHYFDATNPGLGMELPHSKITEDHVIVFDRNWTDKQKKDYEYISVPTEIHARIMSLRWRAGFAPDHEVSLEELNAFMKRAHESGELTPGSPNFDSDVYDLEAISKNRESLLALLNLMV